MNKNKILKSSFFVATILSAIVLAGCSLGSGAAATTPPATTTVTKGDITTFITASGNLSYPDTQDVRFEISGTVSEVLVKAGDIVKKGDVLVKMDDSDIQDKIKTDLLAINSAKISLEKVTNTYKQKTYPYTYTTFGVDIPFAVGNINSAEARVTSARDTLAKARTLSEMSDAQDELTNALTDLDNAINKLTFGQGDALFRLDQNGRPISVVGTDYWSLRAAQLDIQNAQAQLDNANNNLANDNGDLDKTLVKAPFDGLVTNVTATDGAIINKGNVAFTMTNPNKLEADVLVNEIDIFSVKINGTATVSVDAANGLIVPAAVTYIQPVATIQSGVVNYSVTVTLNQTAPAGNITGTPPAGSNSTKLKTGAQNTASFSTLRQGLSVTVNILKETRKNILLIPNRALIRQGTTTSVQVMNDAGLIENKTVQVGISDSKNTEIVQGLSEGEKVVVQNSANRTATPASGGGLFGGARGPVIVPGPGGR